MPEIKVDVELVCTCGNDLNAKDKGGYFEVDPCESCLAEKYNEGIAYGYYGEKR